MAQTNINIRIDENVKKQAETLFSDLGLNMSTAFNLFVRQSIRQGEIPFKITTQAEPFYNSANIKRLEHSIKQMEQGNVVVKTIEELERMENE